jgi:hypothetical protein
VLGGTPRGLLQTGDMLLFLRFLERHAKGVFQGGLSSGPPAGHQATLVYCQPS